MSQAWAVVVASIVSASGAIMVAFVNKFRKENARDHEVVTGMLKIVHRAVQRTESKLDKVDERLTEHIVDHLHKAQDG
jgi:hypothetical protein